MLGCCADGTTSKTDAAGTNCNATNQRSRDPSSESGSGSGSDSDSGNSGDDSDVPTTTPAAPPTTTTTETPTPTTETPTPTTTTIIPTTQTPTPTTRDSAARTTVKVEFPTCDGVPDTEPKCLQNLVRARLCGSEEGLQQDCPALCNSCPTTTTPPAPSTAIPASTAGEGTMGEDGANTTTVSDENATSIGGGEAGEPADESTHGAAGQEYYLLFLLLIAGIVLVGYIFARQRIIPNISRAGVNHDDSFVVDLEETGFGLPPVGHVDADGVYSSEDDEVFESNGNLALAATELSLVQRMNAEFSSSSSDESEATNATQKAGVAIIKKRKKNAKKPKLFGCDNVCGFVGTFAQVAKHEKTCAYAGPKKTALEKKNSAREGRKKKEAGKGLATLPNPFPDHWGKPPLRQTRDLVQWPGGFGRGSGTVRKWIEQKMAQDAAEKVPEGGGNQVKRKKKGGKKKTKKIEAKQPREVRTFKEDSDIETEESDHEAPKVETATPSAAPVLVLDGGGSEDSDDMAF